MTDAPAVREAAASLLEVDPALPRVIGWRAAAELGQEPILPVLSVPSGPWQPPDREALGDETVALVVLDGLLVADTAPDIVLGPGDVVVPWEPGVAVDGLHAVAPRGAGDAVHARPCGPGPHAAARLLARAPATIGARARRRPPRSGCSRCSGGSPLAGESRTAMPSRCRGHSTSAPYRRCCALSEADVTAGVGAGRVRRHARCARRPGWLLRTGATTRVTSGHSRARRDQLRARGAEQLALARAIGADYDAVIQQLRAHPRAGTSTRAARRRGWVDRQDLMEA